MKRRFARIFVILTALMLVLASTVTSFADMEGREDYNYTIKVYAGNEGKFVNPLVGTVSDGGKTLTITKKAGELVDISIRTTGLTMNKDSEYYPRGFRIAGHDAGLSSKEVQVSVPQFEVYEDVSYQASYGLKGGMIEYRVRYVDGDGHDLMEPDTYFGMAGDKPIVAARYIDGYQPKAYNITGTLKADGSNEWRFPYTKVSTVAAGNDTDNNGTNGNGTNGANGNNGANGTADGNGTAGANNAADTNIGSADNGNRPAEVIDLDDDSTPLAEGSGEGDEAQAEESESGGIPTSALIGGGACVVVAAAAAAIIAARRRREDGEE